MIECHNFFCVRLELFLSLSENRKFDLWQKMREKIIIAGWPGGE